MHRDGSRNNSPLPGLRRGLAVALSRSERQPKSTKRDKYSSSAQAKLKQLIPFFSLDNPVWRKRRYRHQVANAWLSRKRTSGQAKSETPVFYGKNADRLGRLLAWRFSHPKGAIEGAMLYCFADVFGRDSVR